MLHSNNGYIADKLGSEFTSRGIWQSSKQMHHNELIVFFINLIKFKLDFQSKYNICGKIYSGYFVIVSNKNF